MAGITNPPLPEHNAPPCPRPEGCCCTFTWRDTRWAKGDHHAQCVVHLANGVTVVDGEIVE